MAQNGDGGAPGGAIAVAQNLPAVQPPQNLSGLTISVAPPPAFLSAPGDPSMPFRLWSRLVENYFAAICFQNQLPDLQQVRLLIPMLGAEGGRIYFTLPETPDATRTLATELHKLEQHFAPLTNPIAARVPFRSRIQRSGESFDSWYTELRQLIRDCEFGAQAREEEELRDMIVQGVVSKDTRTRLLRQGRDLTLENAVTICRQVEQATIESKSIAQGHTQPARDNAQIGRVQQTQQRQQQRHRQQIRVPKASAPPTQNPATQQSPSTSGSGAGKVCFRCKSSAHLANSESCPARSNVCRDCKVKGHFPGARYCKKKATRGVTMSDEEDLGTGRVLSVHSPKRRKIFTTLKLQAPDSRVACRFLADSGSDVSMITHSQYLAHFNGEALVPSSRPLHNFDGSPIKTVYGILPRIGVHFGSRYANIDFYVVPDSCPAVLGLDIIGACELVIDGKSMSVRSTSRESIIETHPNLFLPGIGCSPNYVHKIQLRPDAVPFIAKDRDIPLALRPKADRTIGKLMGQGIFEPAEGVEWLHPMVYVDKPSSEDVRVCGDMIHLNEQVIPDRFPLPNPDELVLRVQGSTIFSKLDLVSGFFHLPLAKESRPLTAFMHRKFGVLQHTRLPMGYTSSPSVFQKFMHCVLGALPGVEVFIDDILVHGKTLEEHDENLERCLCALEAEDLRLNPAKIQLRLSQVDFCGHLISADGISPNSEGKVKALRSAPAPTNKKELRSFLGLATFYLKFLEGFATVSEPLRALTRENVHYVWTEECQSAFERLKEMVCSAPTLGIFNPACETFVSCDASDVGLGAVLSQLQDTDTEKPLAFGSHVLSQAERKYSTGEKEALSCVWACEKWYKYLIGHRFTLRTDHQALVALLKRTGLKSPALGRVDRWYHRLLKFDFKIVFRPGSKNQPADALSRLPTPDEFALQDDDSEFVCIASSGDVTLFALSLDEIIKATAEDSVLSRVISFVENGWPNNKNQLDSALLPFFHVRKELFVARDCLFRLTSKSDEIVNRLVVPSILQTKILELAHEGHPGIVRTKQRIRSLYWWPGYDSQIETFVKYCLPCHESGKTSIPEKVPISAVKFPSKAWEKLSIDITGPFETAPSYAKFVLVLTDYYSKWPEIFLCSEITSAVVIKNLEFVFARDGYPESLVSDNGPQFVSEKFEEYLKSCGIKHILSAVYNPTGNALVERCNRWIKEGVQVAYSEGSNFADSLRKLLIAFRSTDHATTGKSPSELLHNRKMRTKLNILPLEPELTDSHAKVRQRVTQRQSQYTNSSSDRSLTDPLPTKSAESARYKPGDYVRIRMNKIRNVPKGRSPLSAPLKVVKVLGPYTFRLSDGKKWNSRRLVPSFEINSDISSELGDIGDDPCPAPQQNPIVPAPMDLQLPPAVHVPPPVIPTAPALPAAEAPRRSRRENLGRMPNYLIREKK